MLNIEDVRRRLKDNPEPIEVTNIRNLILSSFGGLIFKEDTHQYFLPNKKNIKNLVEYNCVSNTVHDFKPYEDWVAIRERYAIKNQRDVEDVEKDWHYNNIIATNEGTGVHLYGEMWTPFLLGKPEDICDIIKPQYQDGYLLPHGPKERACAKFNEDLFYEKDLYPILAETRVYTSVGKYKLNKNYAGTFDLLYYYKHPTDNSKSGCLIMDFKTNKTLIDDYKRSTGEMLLDPFGDLYNENFGVYTIQLGCYQIPLNSLGIPVLGRRIIWLKGDETYKKISTIDVSERLLSIFK